MNFTCSRNSIKKYSISLAHGIILNSVWYTARIYQVDYDMWKIQNYFLAFCLFTFCAVQQRCITWIQVTGEPLYTWDVLCSFRIFKLFLQACHNSIKVWKIKIRSIWNSHCVERCLVYFVSKNLHYESK